MNADAVTDILLALAGGGLGVGLINGLLSRRKTRAEAESIEVTTATQLIRSITEEVGRLQARIAELEGRVTASERRALDAERRANESEGREHELRGQIGALSTAYTITRNRVDYLTSVVVAAGLAVAPWTPPNGIVIEEGDHSGS
jgi:hypothetical protein